MLPAALPVDCGRGWNPAAYHLRSHDEQPLGHEPHIPLHAISGQASKAPAAAAARSLPSRSYDKGSNESFYLLPLQACRCWAAAGAWQLLAPVAVLAACCQRWRICITRRGPALPTTDGRCCPHDRLASH